MRLLKVSAAAIFVGFFLSSPDVVAEEVGEGNSSAQDASLDAESVGVSTSASSIANAEGPGVNKLPSPGVSDATAARSSSAVASEAASGEKARDAAEKGDDASAPAKADAPSEPDKDKRAADPADVEAETASAENARPEASIQKDKKEEGLKKSSFLDLSFLKNWSLGGYGELLVTTEFFGPDPTEEYDSSYHQTDVDLARVVFFVGYRFADWLSFESEIEFEHGGTGAAMEVEWDEFGEYEQEIEKGGEIVLEQAFLSAELGPYFELRIGHLLVPVGMISGYHQPILFSSVHRAESESHMIPSAWHETGAELAFKFKGLNVQVQGVSGLDSTGFSSSEWIAGGSQGRFESVSANDWAAVLRVDYSGFKGLMFGVSGYTSNTTRNRPKRDMYDTKARVFIGDLHLRYNWGPFRVAALGMFGKLTNADLVTEKNSSLSQYLEVPRTAVASAAYAYYVEAALDVFALLMPDSKHRLDVFLRNDGYDTMWKAPDPDSDYDNPLLQRQVLTAGLNYFPHPRVVLKGEYVSRWINRDSDWGRHQHELNFALGFVL